MIWQIYRRAGTLPYKIDCTHVYHALCKKESYDLDFNKSSSRAVIFITFNYGIEPADIILMIYNIKRSIRYATNSRSRSHGNDD